MKVLSVRVDRLRRWYAPGVLLIGDAAHAMSPIGGVGINLAVQDAVAAARILAAPIRQRRLNSRVLAKVQSRRTFPTVGTQTLQVVIQQVFLGRFSRRIKTGHRAGPVADRQAIPGVCSASRHGWSGSGCAPST